MNWTHWAYLLFGASLVIVFIWIMIHYYRPKRKHKVEEPKYRMLEDDEKDG